MHAPHPTGVLDHVAETAVIGAWLAVPLFAALGGGALAAPLHAAAIATLLTLALRGWRSARRRPAIEELRLQVAVALAPGALHPSPAQHGAIRAAHARAHRHSRYLAPHDG